MGEIGAALDRVMASCDVPARLEVDPVSIVHRYRRPADRELVGLMASAVAFGNAKAFRVKLEQALARLGPDIASVADDELARTQYATQVDSARKARSEEAELTFWPTRVGQAAASASFSTCVG